MSNGKFGGPRDLLGPGLHKLVEGVWVTSGRTALVSGDRDLLLIDPGDEPIFDGNEPFGPLSDILRVSEITGKRVGRILITHGHPDHIANLPPLLSFLQKRFKGGAPQVVAHVNSPVRPDIGIDSQTVLEEAEGLTAYPLLGHSPYKDDLAFFLPGAKILFSGDIAQPKGETWAEAFYPSPYPYFTDGDVYVASLQLLLSLDFETLVTGHREIRKPPFGRGWIELTRDAILRVGREVDSWEGEPDPLVAGREIFVKLCGERGIPPEVVAARMNPPGTSSFDRFDMPGVVFYWRKRFGEALGSNG